MNKGEKRDKHTHIISFIYKGTYIHMEGSFQEVHADGYIDVYVSIFSDTEVLLRL